MKENNASLGERSVYRSILCVIMNPSNLASMVEEGLVWNIDGKINYDGIREALKAKVQLYVGDLSAGDNFVKIYLTTIFSELNTGNTIITTQNLLEEARETETWQSNLA